MIREIAPETVLDADALHAAAEARAREEDATWPKALQAHFEPTVGLVMIKLSTGGWFGFEADQAQQTEGATPEQLHVIEISPSGFGLYFPAIDADVYLPSILQGRWGSKNWLAARNGKLGGARRSPAKSAAAKENGKRGGRPRKTNGSIGETPSQTGTATQRYAMFLEKMNPVAHPDDLISVSSLAKLLDLRLDIVQSAVRDGELKPRTSGPVEDAELGLADVASWLKTVAEDVETMFRQIEKANR